MVFDRIANLPMRRISQGLLALMLLGVAVVYMLIFWDGNSPLGSITQMLWVEFLILIMYFAWFGGSAGLLKALRGALPTQSVIYAVALALTFYCMGSFLLLVVFSMFGPGSSKVHIALQILLFLLLAIVVAFLTVAVKAAQVQCPEKPGNDR